MLISPVVALAWQLFLAAGADGYGQPSASLWKDQLFVAVEGRSNTFAGAVFRGSFSTERRGVSTPVEHHNLYATDLIDQTQAKLQIRDDRVLLTATGHAIRIYPMTKIPLLERSQFGERLCTAQGYTSQNHLIDQQHGNSEDLLFPPHRKPDVPVPPTPVDMFGNPTPEQIEYQRKVDYTRQARFDVQIAGPRSVRLLRIEKSTLFISFEFDGLFHWYGDYFDNGGELIKPLPKPPERQLRTGKVPEDFTESFAAYPSGGRDYLVTRNGKVYMVVPKGKDGVEVTAVWNDPKQRITGVVQDPASDTVFGWGFAGADGSPNRFYVKLAPMPVAVPYKLTVPLWNDFADAYLESYECARAFRKAAK